jgi:hypothetical protein
VSGLFGLDALADELREIRVAAAAPKDGPGVPLDRREQAIANLPLGGEAEPIAIGTKGLRHGVDEPDSD